MIVIKIYIKTAICYRKKTKVHVTLHVPTPLYRFFFPFSLVERLNSLLNLHFASLSFSVSSVNHAQPNRRRRFQLPFRLRKPPLLRGSRRSFAGGAEQPSHLPLRPLRRANLRHLLYLPSQTQPLQVKNQLLLRLLLRLPYILIFGLVWFCFILQNMFMEICYHHRKYHFSTSNIFLINRKRWQTTKVSLYNQYFSFRGPIK